MLSLLILCCSYPRHAHVYDVAVVVVDEIQTEVAKAIGDMLAHNTTLQVLNLSGCLSSDGVKEITSGLGVNRGLLKYVLFFLLHRG